MVQPDCAGRVQFPCGAEQGDGPAGSELLGKLLPQRGPLPAQGADGQRQDGQADRSKTGRGRREPGRHGGQLGLNCPFSEK